MLLRGLLVKQQLKNTYQFCAGSNTIKLVLLRHGESQWNKENRFTGWYDVSLSTKGIEEARSAGKILKQNNFKFDKVYLSMLTRAITTFNYAADELQCHHLPIVKSWILNERHYGALQGLNKAETAAKYGDEQVMVWRRSYATPPPPLEDNDERHPKFDDKYKDVDQSLLPNTESLNECVKRVIPYWESVIRPEVEQKNILIVAHGNSLRALVKYLKNISDEDIISLNIPTSVPLIFEFDKNMNYIKDYYLADPEELKKKQQAVADQGKAKK